MMVPAPKLQVHAPSCAPQLHTLSHCKLQDPHGVCWFVIEMNFYGHL
jgi:hypothetical protein